MYGIDWNKYNTCRYMTVYYIASVFDQAAGPACIRFSSHLTAQVCAAMGVASNGALTHVRPKSFPNHTLVLVTHSLDLINFMSGAECS